MFLFIVDCDGENMTCNTPTHEQTNEREKGEKEILATSINQNIRACMYVDISTQMALCSLAFSICLSLFLSSFRF